MSIKILTSGEKLKEIRTSLGLKQYELAGEQVTANLISMIEKGNSNLTPKVAKIILKNLKKLCVDRNLQCPIKNYTELTECESKQVNIAFKELYNELKNSLKTKDMENAFKLISDAMQLVNRYSDLVNDNLLSLAKLLYNEKDYKDAYIFYTRIFENSDYFLNNNSIDTVFKTVKEFLRICCALERFIDPMFVINKMLKSSLLSKEQTLDLIQDKIGLLCRNEQYKTALKEISKIKLQTDKLDYERKYNIEMLEAGCYLELHSYEQAIVKHEEMLKQYKGDLSKEVSILTNLARLHKFLNNQEKLRTTINKIINLMNTNDISDYLTDVYYEIACCYEFIQDDKKALVYLGKALKSAIQCTRYKMYEKEFHTMQEILNIYKRLGTSKDLILLHSCLKDLIKNSDNAEYYQLILDFIAFYLQTDNTDAITDLIG